MSEMVVLVDEKDHPIGYEEKMKAHSDGGKLHRAFSIFIYNSKNQMLLQLRSNAKHHFQNLWSNGCCSHPRKGEELDKAAHRKMKHEFDHVFLGEYNGVPKPNPQEIDDWKWVTPTELKQDLSKNPEHYTPWLKPAFDGLVERNGIKL